ncbi:protein involved in gliding motility SprA [Leeuwenhoekiella polynyae]|uniref:Protein involved in gliding motility SprA n=2 Tax=Leeuwenhoekiella polynyae TaxID=1550906 RepID=A0A4V1KQ11_9FLAO|nr:protein involved in gliding motility SprA [Leeuwenhoekiella polynyae]
MVTKLRWFSLQMLLLSGTLLCSMPMLAQEEEQDSTQTGVSLGRLNLKNPNSIISKYTYDPLTDRYVYTESLGQYNINYPRILTPDEFKELVKKERMRAYFQQKIAAVDGRTEEGKEDQKSLLPNFYVNSGLFESIFGGNSIEFIPQGSVEMDIGGLFTKQDNPSFSPRNRSNFSFDFDQRISLSLLGKVGTRLQVNAVYDTESTFNFQNQIKLEYTPDEDDIVQKIEVGNVSMPLNSALIQGSQSLFGVKAQLQFGKTTITGVFSEQQSQTNQVLAQGDGTIQDFEIFALEYDENRHYFLAQYFRDTYDRALANYPFKNSNIQITRIEVWVTNRTQRFENTRNIVAIQDIGESDPSKIGLPNIPGGFVNLPSGAYPRNASNDFNPFGIDGTGQSVLTSAIRDVATVDQGFGGVQVADGSDYVSLENARQLTPSEYTLDTQLGYISLNQRLNNDEVLAVAFQYTVNGEVYQVGEFGNDGVDATSGAYVDTDGDGVPDIVDVDADGDGVNENGQDADGDQIADAADPDQTNGRDINNDGILDSFITPGQGGTSQALVVKLLKSNITDVNEPVWDLMMKNIYGLGVGQLEPDGFRMNIVYNSPSPINYITAADGGPALPDDVANTPLLNVFNLDRLTQNGDPQTGGDGFFDFVEGTTVNVRNGSIIFTSVEPFGEYLFNKLRSAGGETYENDDSYNANQEKYVYRSLYNSTKTVAQDNADKNVFQLQGTFKSKQEEGIPIGGFNIPQGSVTVTAGGRVLQEGLDYSVDYQRGRVIILDQALKGSGVPIQVSTENNSLFGQQTKRFTGLNVEHQFSEDFMIGGTLLNVNERPLTQKATYSFEPINNTIFGMNANFSTEVPFLTRLVNKLPNIDTDVPSNISLRGEVAYLLPGQPKATDFGGEAASYIDDFEGTQTSLDISSPLQWFLSSAPIGLGGELTNGDLAAGYKRAKLAWYSIDPIFYTSQRPDGITDADVSTYATRRVFRDEIFPEQDIIAGTTQALFTLDLAYYPGERGPYNFSLDAQDGILENPEQNFGGIMRSFASTDFEQSNVEFIEFWVMDPFIYAENATNTGGRLTLNLGNISEDVLKDGRKQYENGLPQDGSTSNTVSTVWGKVPTNQALIYAFDTEGEQRTNQDVGYDGLSDEQEAEKFPGFAGLEDPSGDNYQYFVAATGSVLNRYKNYNGLEGNSPVNVSQTDRGSTTVPDVEDFNRDFTMNTVDSYYEYELDITPQSLNIENEFIVDQRDIEVTLQNGNSLPVTWYQFKIPISQSTGSQGGISDFRSIRFMRMFMSGWQDPTVLRFGAFDLVRGDYRRYLYTLDPDESDPTTESTRFEVTSVNIEENNNRNPIPYVLPPGVFREELINNNNNIRQNEQSLSLRVCDLETQDARAVYKNFRLDMRQYKNLEMFIHLESLLNETPVQDNEVVAIIRMGTDLTRNFYQIELPLSPTAFGTSSPDLIWPDVNQLKLPLEVLQTVKATFFNGAFNTLLDEITYFDQDGNVIADPASTPYESGRVRVGIQGNPSFGDVRVLMLGLKNGNDEGRNTVCAEAWFNELRLSGLQNQGGWAGIINMDANLADFATVSGTARQSTIGFGGIDAGPNQRNREDVKSFDMVTNLNLGQLMPKKWGVKLPFNYARGGQTITPQYDPLYTDLELDKRLAAASSEVERERINDIAIERTNRESINFIGVRKERTGDKKPMPWDIENLTLAYSHNQEDHKDFEIEEAVSQNVRAGATYAFAFKPKTVEPFNKNDSLFAGKYWKLLKDFNFNYLPASVNISSNITRQYSRQKFRDLLANENSIPIPEYLQRNYQFDRNFTVNFPVTKSLRINLDQYQNRIVRNYLNPDSSLDENAGGVYSSFFDVGTPDRHNQTMQLNYDLPVNKLPYLEFIKSTYSYSADFQWTRGSYQLQTLDGIPDLGNSIQNANTHALQTTLDMKTLYDALGLSKKTAGPSSKSDRSRAVPTLGTPTQPRPIPEENKLSAADKAKNTLIGIATGIKRIQINYEQNNGTYLPGYLPGVGFLGTVRPTTAFVFGSQAEVRDYAARQGWLTLYQEYNEQYSEVENRNLDMQIQTSFLEDLTIDVNMNRIYQETYNENYRVDPTTLQYNSLTGNTLGNYSISTLMIGTAFNSSSLESSANFNQFRSNRLVIAERLAEDFYGNDQYARDEFGYPVGFGRTSQRVLLPAFLSAYTPGNASNVSLGAFRSFPLPNWNLKYTGLMKLDWFKKRFKRFSVNHGYQSGYTINQFRTNLNYDRSLNNNVDDVQTNQAGDFISPTLYSNINLTELFSPLIRLDFEMQNSIKILAELRKDRTLSLSFDNNLLTEIHGNEYIIGLGYRLKDIRFATRIGGRQTILKSDLNFRADLSLRQNETIVRYLDLENSQITAGQDIYGLTFKADYALSKNLTAIFYYDHSFATYAISTAYPQTTIRSGITLRYNFGN